VTQILRVALDTPLRRLFDYLPPISPDPARRASPGVRVRVPFGRQRLVGLVVELATASELPVARLKPVSEVLDTEPTLDPDALALLRWAADYYHHPLGEVIASALPKALRLGAPLRPLREEWQLTEAGTVARSAGEPRRAPKQRALLERLAASGALTAQTLDEQFPGWRESARSLVKRGWIASREVQIAPEIAPARVRATGPALNEEQRLALEALSEARGRFGAFVLHGITGSGKTEVYLRLIEQVLEQGQGALVLVPEIGLTPQLLARFSARFATPLAVLHSGLSDGERLAAWRLAFSGEARLVLGTRSAVFAPVRALGLIVVDEEHDASFKQHEGGFRYSARDLAVMRAQKSAVPIVLGSATPALETLNNVAGERYRVLRLTRRATPAAPPLLKLLDLRHSAVHGGIAGAAIDSMRRHLEADGQVLVFINRRGYAPTLLCTGCGWMAPCRECDARLTVHLAAGRLRCHHCGADAPLPERCPQCGFAVKPVGQGTERVAETLATLFPQAALARLDRDVVRHPADLAEVMQRMASGAARILVGTQMVTKGHDFPNVTLVVVLNADQGLFSTDFRAPERLAQTLVQVAGRAGRGERPGEVLIQTEFPDHPLLQSLLAEGYDGFARAALTERAQAAWPPFSRLAAVRDSATTHEAALGFLAEARRLAQPPRGVKLLGPVPAAMARRAGRYHAQLLIESRERSLLQGFLADWLPEVERLKSARAVRWSLDVDPLELF
jgi:primosomal protein N' (replication factor Y) (superfamily II helicase)